MPESEFSLKTIIIHASITRISAGNLLAPTATLINSFVPPVVWVVVMENGRNAFYTPGYSKAYAGAMYTEKTSMMLLELLKIERAGIPVRLYKPGIDTRDGEPNRIRSRNGLVMPCMPIPIGQEEWIADEVNDLGEKVAIVGIDEAQFFSDDLVKIVEWLRRERKHVIMTMLDLDFAGRPFGSAPELMAAADEVVKLYGVCMVPECKERGTRTQRLINGKPARASMQQVAVQHLDDHVMTYELRCFFHHVVPQ